MLRSRSTAHLLVRKLHLAGTSTLQPCWCRVPSRQENAQCCSNRSTANRAAAALRAGPNAAAALQELLGGKYGEMSTLGNYLFQSFNFRSKSKLRPFYSLVASITAEELGHVELVTNGVAMLNDGPDLPEGEVGGQDISDAPYEDMQDIRLAAAFLSNGGGATPVNSNGASWNIDYRHHHGQRGHRPAAQLPSRMRRPPPQAARLRDHDRSHRPRGLRLPAGARLGACSCLCPGAEEDHRRRDREDAADAEHQSRQDPRMPEISGRGLPPPAVSFSPDDYREMAGIWANGEMALPGDPPGELEVVDGIPRAADPRTDGRCPRPSPRTTRRRKCSRSRPSSTRSRAEANDAQRWRVARLNQAGHRSRLGRPREKGGQCECS